MNRRDGKRILVTLSGTEVSKLRINKREYTIGYLNGKFSLLSIHDDKDNEIVITNDQLREINGSLNLRLQQLDEFITNSLSPFWKKTLTKAVQSVKYHFN